MHFHVCQNVLTQMLSLLMNTTCPQEDMNVKKLTSSYLFVHFRGRTGIRCNDGKMRVEPSMERAELLLIKVQ